METRLRCTACGAPVCPQCMVPCPVGFKCLDCVRQTRSHVSQVSGKTKLLALACGLVAGVVYGYLRNFLLSIGMFRFFGFPLLGLGLTYFVGILAGRGVQKVLHYKYGGQVAFVVTLGLLLGFCFGPFLEVLWLLLDLPAVVNPEMQTLLARQVLVEFVGAYLFTIGVQKAFRAA